MARDETKRATVAVRLSPAGIRAIDDRAVAEDRTRSEMIRRLLAYAVWKMPKGWKP